MRDARAETPGAACTYELQAGALTLTTSPASGPELFRIAERMNPKRAFLFVSTVLGRHIPVDPVAHRAALRRLSEGVSAHLLQGPVFVMGFAETAVGIGAGVFDCLRESHADRDMGYLTTTRFAPAGAREWFTIEESHSHAVDHIVLHPREGVVHHGPTATLVLVDDETTTGKTFAELATGLRNQGLEFGCVVLVTLTDWSDGRAEVAVNGIFPGAATRSVALQRGSWSWAPKRDRAPSDLPGTREAHCPRWRPTIGQAFAAPRNGLAASEKKQTGDDILRAIEGGGFEQPRVGERVLVVGAGEHVWQPMLAAEAICARDIETRFITTTRSPILKGETIRHKVSFSDHYGEGFWMYMHNVVPSDWDRIVLFTETGVEGVPTELLQWLGRADVIDGSGAVAVMTVSGRSA